MITVIDRISYLPESKKPLDQNKILNHACKKIVANIKGKLRGISSEGKNAKVTISGRPSGGSKALNINIDCEDEHLMEKIKAVLGK